MPLDRGRGVWYTAVPQLGVTESVVASHAPAAPLTKGTTMTDPHNDLPNDWDLDSQYEDRWACNGDCESDPDAFADAAAHMSQEDWDDDNAWLASAGWGEM